jgi:hypothetical protein
LPCSRIHRQGHRQVINKDGKLAVGDVELITTG